MVPFPGTWFADKLDAFTRISHRFGYFFSSIKKNERWKKMKRRGNIKKPWEIYTLLSNCFSRRISFSCPQISTQPHKLTVAKPISALLLGLSHMPSFILYHIPEVARGITWLQETRLSGGVYAKDWVLISVRYRRILHQPREVSWVSCKLGSLTKTRDNQAYIKSNSLVFS